MEILYILILYILVSVISIFFLRKRMYIIISLVPCMMVLSNILGSAKILSMPLNLSVPAGIIPYMFSFFLIDVLNEFYGEKRAKEAVIAGIIAIGISILLITIAWLWQPSVFTTEEKLVAFERVFSLAPRLFLASLLSFGVSSYLNILIFKWIKARTGMPFLWLRENLSTITSVLASNLIFIPLGYFGTGYPVLNMIFGHTVAQTAIALLDTPFIYTVSHFYHRQLISEIKNKIKNGSSFVAIKNGDIFESKERGLKPFTDAIEKFDLKDSYIGDKFVGKASALLASHALPSLIYASSITKEALKILDRNKIRVVYEKEISRMKKCEYDELLDGTYSPREAYEKIRTHEKEIK